MADVGSTLAVSPRDLVVIIANLFENAVNAVGKLKSTDRYIDIILQESSQRFLIKMENSCKNHLIVDEELYGIGIHSVIFSTEIYDGMYDFSARDGKFIAKISLNLI